MKIDFTKSICGYRLQELLYLNNSCYALGWNPTSGAPFATWKVVSTGQYWDFHIFKTLREARQDLFSRGKSLLSKQELLDLIPDTLTAEEKALFHKIITCESEKET